MNWLIIATIGYLLLATEIIFDKFLLSSKRVSHPVIYAFYSGATAPFALILAPLGFHGIGFLEIIFRFISGIIFIYGMFALFYALSKSEASRVTPVVGAVIPMIIFFLAFIFLGEHLGLREIWGLMVLIIGGLCISYDFHSDIKGIFKGFYWCILAGILLSISATMNKSFYSHDNFWDVYIWTRMGAFLGVLTFFLIPQWRKKIVSSLAKFKNPQKEHQQSAVIYVSARITGGIGSAVKEGAASIASVTIINALVSTEYVFIFIMGLLFSLRFPRIFQEKRDAKNIVQKILAIILITIGIVLVSGKK